VNPRRIALYNLTTTVKAGGVEIFNWELGRFLAARGHEVHIYGGEGPLAAGGPGSVPVYTYPYTDRSRFPDLGTRFRKFLERLSFSRHALPDLIGRRYDVIVLSKPYDIPAALVAARRTGAKVVYDSGGTEFFPGYGFLVRRLDFLLACSAFNAEQIRRYCGESPRVLWNGVDTGRFRPSPASERILRRFGLSGGEPVVVTTGRLVGLKGVRHGMLAVARLRRDGIPARHLIVGDGEERSRLEALARELGDGGAFLFAGEVRNADLPEVYSVARAGLFPTVGEEAFGIAVAEAMACGVPVVASRVGGIPEVVLEGGGLLVPPRDEGAIAGALHAILSDPAKGREMGESARVSVNERFSWEKVAGRFEEWVLSGPGGGAP
jgi:glycosyltransferase involved in cell wall biosynthesis